MALAAEVIDLQTPRAFLPLLRPARYKGAHGGRGSGKSHHFAEAIVERCLIQQGCRVICIREVQKTLKESAKRLIEDKIRAMGVGRMFRILEDRIVTPGDGVILFQGMQDHTAESVKSLEGFDVAWIEEAHTLSARSLELLRPTIRKRGSEIWASWNPNNKEAPIDAFFRGPEAPPDSVCVQVNYFDNPFFPPELEQERQWDKRNNPDRYAHIWEGDYEPQAVGAIWTRAKIDEHRLTGFERPSPEATLQALEAAGIVIERIVVAVDHATSNEAGSNEHGIIVAGRGADGRGYLLQDNSRKGTPRQWAETAVSCFDIWKADAIVIERNQGGDLVRENLETERVGLPIIEVVATRGKHVRAEPIASRYDLGQVAHVGKFDDLERQMCLITAAGYEGAGSPDRADALVWAMTELFPTMGNGLVYPIHTSDILVAPFQLPTTWRRVCATVVDSRGTSALWGAIDDNTGTLHIYAEHDRSGIEPTTHAAAINARGAWIPGIVNPRGDRRTVDDGYALLAAYAAHNVRLSPVDDMQDAGILATADRMLTGRLKVFSTCERWIREFRGYHRDENDRPVEDECRLMVATRQMVASGLTIATLQPPSHPGAGARRAADRRAGY